MHPEIKRKLFNDIYKSINFINIKNEENVMSKQALFEQIKGFWTEFEEQHNGTTKKSQANARKAIGEIKKLVTTYKKASVEESK